jgi:hypothetical protein
MPAETAMCEQCKAQIEHYKRIARNITDQKTIDGLTTLVAELREKRAALHPEPSRESPG